MKQREDMEPDAADALWEKKFKAKPLYDSDDEPVVKAKGNAYVGHLKGNKNMRSLVFLWDS